MNAKQLMRRHQKDRRDLGIDEGCLCELDQLVRSRNDTVIAVNRLFFESEPINAYLKLKKINPALNLVWISQRKKTVEVGCNMRVGV
jgi:hypothetical protein